MKKNKCLLEKKIYIFFKFENFVKIIHANYIVINFAPSTKSFTENRLPSTNLEQFSRRIKSPLTR